MSRRIAVALFIAFVMAFATMPIGASTDVAASQEEPPAARLVDNGDGSYTLKSEYMEKSFGIRNSSPSDVDDPVGHDPVGISPLELVYWYGGDDSGYDVRKVSSDSVIRQERLSNNTDSNHSTSFAAALTRNNDGAHTVSDQGSRWNQSGFALQDWFCDLYYDNSNGNLMLSVTNGENLSKVSVDSLAGTTPYPVDQVNLVTSIQSSNILRYAVGDFDNDGNEEIAIHHWYGIYVLGLNQVTLALEIEDRYDVPRYSGYENTLFTPVCIAAGDADYDGDDEIIVVRGYYKPGQPGNMEYTDIGILSSEGNSPVWQRVSLNDPKNPASVLDSIMTSVGCGDVDNDGAPEIIIGGYLWDNTQTSSGYTSDWSKSAGELYLAYAEPLQLMEGDADWKGLTILGDDNGTATTRYISDNGDFKNHYALNDHNRADTSVYLTDDNDNPSGLCRSVNWSNWTIPLAVGSLSGDSNGNTMDEVYFDKWFYKLEKGEFRVHKTTPQLTKVMDNNNVVFSGISVGQIIHQDASDYDTTEEFMVFYAADLERSFDNGMTEWVFVIYSDSTGGEANRLYSVDMPSPYRDLRDYGLYNMGRAFAGNYDNDTYYIDLQFRLFTYTNPTLIAAIEAVPYEQDLSDLLFGGSDAIGGTDYTKYTSHETSTESTCNFNIGFCGGLDVLVKADLQLKYTHDESWSTSKTITLSTTYSSSHASVAMFVVPTDMYFYKVYTPQDGKYTVSYEYIPFYGDPVQTMFDYSEYSRFVDDYNRSMKAFDEDFSEVPKLEMFDSTEGDIQSYGGQPSDPLHEIPVYYKGSGNSSKITQSVDLSKSTGRSWANGGFIDLAVQAKIAFGMITAGAGFNLGGSYSESTNDVSGLAFSSTLSQGMEVNYLGERNEANRVLSNYTMTGSMWAEMRSMDIDGMIQDYVYVGYTVDSYTTAPRLGEMVPDVYVPGGGDDDDPYNPTDDSVCLQVTLPGYAEEQGPIADRYLVQVFWQGGWYTVDGSVLGFSSYVGDAENGWTMIDGTLAPGPEDRTVWVKVDGLSNVSDLTFKFRLNSVWDSPNRSGINPTLPVTAYKDTRTQEHLVVGSLTAPRPGSGIFDVEGVHELVVDSGSFHDMGDGLVLMYAKTGLDPGEKVDLWYYDGSSFSLVCEGLTVYEHGYVVWTNEDMPGEYDGRLTMAMSAFILVGCISFLVAFYRRG